MAANGDEAVSFCCATEMAKTLAHLFIKYASHGLSHGHFDDSISIYFDKATRFTRVTARAIYRHKNKNMARQYLPENTLMLSTVPTIRSW